MQIDYDCAAICPVCLLQNPVPFAQITQRDYWRCPHCEATFLDPQQLPDRPTEHAHYHLHRNEVHDEGYRRFLARLATPLLERLEPGLMGLDFGCGPGPALAHMLQTAGHHMSIYDPLFYPDAAALKATYDFVTCTEVVEHFHHPALEFARLNSLLKPGGWLAVMTGFLSDDVVFANWHYRRDPTHIVFYREQTFRVLAQRYRWHCDFPCADVVLFRAQG